MNLAVELARRGIAIKRHGSKPYELRVCCPFCVSMHHRPDTKFRYGLNLITGAGHCFNCGFSTQRKGAILLLQKIGASPGGESISAGFDVGEQEKPKKIKLPIGFEKLENVDENDPLFGQARRYVKKRGITTRQLHEHEIGATVADDFFRYRIVFPVRLRGKLVGMVGRDWTGRSTMKYLNTSGAKTVYNYAPDKYGKEVAIISEGITKALAIERALNYKVCSTALLGNQITDSQANILKVFDEIVLFPDPDNDGMKGFLGVAVNLQSVVKKVTMAWPWPKEQADDMQPEDIRAAIANRRVMNPLRHMQIKSLMMERGNE